MVGTSEPLTITLSKPFVIENSSSKITISSIEIYKLLIAELIKP
jgi:hypothetical protein